MDKNVLVIGSTCVDVIIRVDHLPRTEENLHPESQRFAIGGCAYNVANILGRAGATLSQGDFAKLSIHKQGTEA